MYCQSDICAPYNVVYTFSELHTTNITYILFEVRFIITFNNLREYHIIYALDTHLLNVVEKTNNKSKIVFTFPIDSLILTPQNVQSKLPILITFS